jgi:hypothetical protein
MPSKAVDPVHEVGHLVDHNHARGVVGQDVRQEPQGGVPRTRRLLGEQAPLREGGRGHGVEQFRQFVLGGAASGGEEQVRHFGPPEELLNQARLADPAPPAYQDAPAGLHRADSVAHYVQRRLDDAQLPVPPDETAHDGPLRSPSRY